MADNLLSYSLVKFGVDGDGCLKLILHKRVWEILCAAITSGAFEVIDEDVQINLEGLNKHDVMQYIERMCITQEPPCPPFHPGGD